MQLVFRSYLPFLHFQGQIGPDVSNQQMNLEILAAQNIQIHCLSGNQAIHQLL